MQIRPAANEIVLADNGPGVPAESRHLIFRPYFTVRDGRGLGLHVVQNLMERNGHVAELMEAGGPLSGACFRLIFASAET